MIAILDYGAGNLFNAEKAFRYHGADVVVTHDSKEISRADKLVLPGVGAFGDCMKNLHASGVVPVLMSRLQAGVPFLGICVGLQLLFEGSEESPDIPGLGILAGKVRKIRAPGEKIPHMGWNSLHFPQGKSERIFQGIPQESYVYFVHSYQAFPDDPGLCTATTFYGETITAAIADKNIQAVQFHPEKSGEIGLKIIRNFIED